MGRTNRQKEKYGIGNELSGDKFNEGTAARTRPFSFEEIMLRRKSKKQTADAEEGAVEPGKISGRDNAETVFDHSESDGRYKRSKDLVLVKHDFEDKQASKKKGEDTFMKEDNLVKGNDKESCDLETNLQVKSKKDTSSRTKGDKIEKRSHHSRNNEKSRDGFVMKHPKETMGKDKHVDRDREELERKTKRKYKNRDDEKIRSEINWSDVKKHDLGKWHNSEPLERRGRNKESSQSHYEEVRPKRRRSRSREHDRDRDGRSLSLSPRAHKRTPYHGQDRGEFSFHSSKDKSGRQYSDVDRNRMSSNGGYASSHNRRHGGHSSGLGGYSPRKRRIEATVKIPSPTNHSPERKSVGWDLQPAETDNISSASMLINFQSPHQNNSSNAQELPSASPVTSNATKPLSGASPNIISMTKNVSADSIQLTQATRRMRRLYLENVPASASDKAVMECLNDFLLSAGVNHIQGTQPCISCIINKEKGHALVEFLTAENATAALSFDGRLFSGSVLKIRRPKDFVEATTGAPEKPVAVVDAISDIVNDSPHKIFVGGISRAMSSAMLMEIASAFGHLKAFRFQVDEDLKEPCAFLQYIDQSVTLKACAGLNGMKLGGQFLTAVQAVPHASTEENSEKPPIYGIPEHAKPLLEKPTKVLKLKNVFKQEDFSSLSGPELEETLEDIRFECARFGTVKSVNIVRNSSSNVTTSETFEVTDHANLKRVFQQPDGDDFTMKTEIMEEDVDLTSGENNKSEPQNDVRELLEVTTSEINFTSDGKSASDLLKNDSSEPFQLDTSMAFVEPTCELDTYVTPQEPLNQLGSNKDQSTYHDGADVQAEESGMRNSLMVEEELRPEEATDDKLQEATIELNNTVEMESDDTEKDNAKQKDYDLDFVFEQGCILVEYLRTEASCIAAHCLHGRLYGDQIVVVGYISHDLYLARFPK